MDENKMINEQELENVTGGGTTGSFVDYKVVVGDNLTRLAKRFKTTIEAIMYYNPIIKDRNFIRVGWVLLIPDNRW